MNFSKKINYLLFLGAVLVMSTLAGISIFASLSSLYANKELRLMNKRLANVIETTSLVRYAQVRAVSPTEKTITVVQKNFFNAGDVAILTVHISDETFIARQELLRTTGIYDTLSPVIPAHLTDIHPGDKVLIFTGAQQGKLTADLVLFGNPL